ncbi:hypothetical protein Van01_56320 [Micromonospora andamanensis]|uniref:Uncharacterized protein n=1 Tax=Micromonospora andamanensis TaxID=1287068 RepID=A0ABQ4I3F8_9ACTN|nr:hypothetical protein Van01_56320 [Micromonospora andamanensis]
MAAACHIGAGAVSARSGFPVPAVRAAAPHHLVTHPPRLLKEGGAAVTSRRAYRVPVAERLPEE